MKTKLFIIAALFALTVPSFGQQSTIWEKWVPLIGEWKGEGSGQPGEGGGTFSFHFDLDQKILVRKGHSEYPATAQKPKIIHDDLMIIYADSSSGAPSKAIYFDNEGHLIHYTITYPEKSIILTSEKTANAPVFRLTYTLLENQTFHTKFEMSADGEKFMTYLEGNSARTE